MIIAPSIIAADFSRLCKEIKKVEDGGADMLHLDIMDGVFVPNLTFGPMLVEAIDRMTRLKLDAHLMITKPEQYLGAFIDAGADWISFHAEATQHVTQCIKFVRNKKKKIGLAISPGTPFNKITEYLPELDFLLIMTVNPGFYGQRFLPIVLRKICQAKNWLMKNKLACLIEVDGGVNRINVHDLAQAGVDILVAGAAVFKTKDYKKAITALRCSKA